MKTKWRLTGLVEEDIGSRKNNQIYLDEMKQEVGASKRQGWCLRIDKVDALEDRIGALEDRSPQETKLEPVPDIGLEPLRLVP